MVASWAMTYSLISFSEGSSQVTYIPQMHVSQYWNCEILCSSFLNSPHWAVLYAPKGYTVQQEHFSFCSSLGFPNTISNQRKEQTRRNHFHEPTFPSQTSVCNATTFEGVTYALFLSSNGCWHKSRFPTLGDSVVIESKQLVTHREAENELLTKWYMHAHNPAVFIRVNAAFSQSIIPHSGLLIRQITCADQNHEVHYRASIRPK